MSFCMTKSPLPSREDLKKFATHFFLEVFKILQESQIPNWLEGQQQINYYRGITLLTTVAKVVQAGIKRQGYTSEPYCSLSAAGSPLTFYPALLLVAYMMIKAVLFIAVKKEKKLIRSICAISACLPDED
jgi:hypothetical protein